MQYFRANYPGPDTIIHSPDWHAPKIYRAAIHASGYAELLEACKYAAEFIQHCSDQSETLGTRYEPAVLQLLRNVLARARGANA
jgi:hypothetical protein